MRNIYKSFKGCHGRLWTKKNSHANQGENWLTSTASRGLQMLIKQLGYQAHKEVILKIRMNSRPTCIYIISFVWAKRTTIHFGPCIGLSIPLFLNHISDVSSGKSSGIERVRVVIFEIFRVSSGFGYL